MQPKKQLKVQYIGIFEEIDSFYWPKMHFYKEGQKIRAWVDPPSFGQCPKENVFFLLRPSLKQFNLKGECQTGPQQPRLVNIGTSTKLTNTQPGIKLSSEQYIYSCT